VGAQTGPDPQHATGALYFSRTVCSESRVRVEFSPGRLEGGATRVGERWSCEVPVRVLVRIRVVFRRSVRVRPDPRARELLVANGRIDDARLVVRTPKRRAIAIVTASGTGRATIFVDHTRCFVQ